MLSFSHQLRTIRRLKIQEGQSIRVDCPFCLHHNTLGVSLLRGKLEWNCFSASCPAKGIVDDEISVEGLRARISTSNSESGGLGAPIPDLLTPIRQPEHIAWLKSVHSWEAYESKLADIVYSPAADRILFKIGKDGYTGRRIDFDYIDNKLVTKKSYGPKWIKYGDASQLFTCGTGEIGVIVEDAPSACAVGVLPRYTGISLLGTTLTSSHKVKLFNYKQLLVCLDPDAAGKSISLTSKLQGLVPSKTVLIPDDLKYYEPSKIEEILNEV